MPKTQNETAEAAALLQRLTRNPDIYAGKPIIRGRRLAVEHVLSMLAVGDTSADILANFPWLEPDDIRACLLFAQQAVEATITKPAA